MKSIETKILAIIGGIVALIMVCTGWTVVSMSKKTVVTDESVIVNLSVEKLASEIDNYFVKYRTMVQQLSRSENAENMMQQYHTKAELLASPEFQEIYQELAHTSAADPAILSVYYADLDSNAAFDGGDWISEPGFNLKEKDYWFGAQSDLDRGYLVTEPYQDSETGNQVVTFAAPVYYKNQSQILGVAAIDVEITVLNKMVAEQEGLYKSQQLKLISQDGTILTSNNSEELLKNVSQAGYAQELLNELQNISDNTISYQQNGVPEFAAVAAAPTVNWKVVMIVDEDDFLEVANKTARTLTVVFTLVVVVLLVVLYLVAKSIVKPLKRLTAITDELAAGNLDVEIDVSSRDEVGRLADSMRHLTERLKSYIDYIEEISAALDDFGKGNLSLNLQRSYDGEFAMIKEALLKTADTFRDTIGNMIQVSDQVATGSVEISNGAQMLAQGTTEQASVLQELAATVQTISENVNKTAKNSKEAADRVDAVGHSADQSSVQMKQMLAAIEEINTKSAEIEKIIKTIEDIAFQTNILALNAAVEAARAGAAGKGFAVVADEVRNLAGKSAEAAKNTTALIEGSMKAVENGTKIANETSGALDEVIEGVKSTITMIGEISEASNEQARSLSQALEGLDQVSSVVQTNSATAEESSASSDILSAQAKSLKVLADRFKL